MHGFINLNKAYDWTSHDCVAKVRKIIRLKKVGHAGTLDPAATGVLPIAVGKATRLLQYLPGDKAYRGTIRFGVQTTTDDLQGEVIVDRPCPGLNLVQIEPLLEKFLGKITQIPPSYSAIQVDGKRLYDLARKGEVVEVPARTVEVFSITILDWRGGEYPELDVQICCGAGTYIRAIARDLGYAANTVATLASLQRTASSGFDLSSSITWEDLQSQVDVGSFSAIAVDTPLQYLPQIQLNPELAIKWCHGQKIAVDEQIDEQINEQIDEKFDKPIMRIYRENEFLGIGSIQASLLLPQMVFTNL